ncbi:VTT domain-containing protein [Nocardioides dubius]|uniref:VTT domain-containing protein n=1 Tax=Nocardioides dubius TaxID=317019 RepID=A0ABP4ECW2_9ACTN
MLIDVLHPLLLGLNWMDPEWLLERFGQEMFWISIAIVFVECGLLFPILPGDSLLFSVGLFIHRAGAGEAGIDVNIVTACIALSIAAFLGNVAGYEIGRFLGPKIYERRGRFLKPEYFTKTEEFFDKHGAKALILGRFVPIVRTFITLVAGVGKMNRRHFFVWSAVGAVLWATGLTLLGYFLGGIEFLQHNIEAAILVIVFVSVLPMVLEWWRHRKAALAMVDDVTDAVGDRIEEVVDRIDDRTDRDN